VGVLQSAELGALRAEAADTARQQVEVGGPPRDEVLLARQIGNPQAVDDIVGDQLEMGRLANGQMDLVGGGEIVRLIESRYSTCHHHCCAVTWMRMGALPAAGEG
jgi:hypothetical protein